MSANVIDNESTSCSVRFLLRLQSMRVKFLQMPIESDQDAVRVMMQNEVKVLIDACTLRSLLVMPWTQRDQKFAVRVTVRQALHDSKSVSRAMLCASFPVCRSISTLPRLFEADSRLTTLAALASMASDKVDATRRHYAPRAANKGRRSRKTKSGGSGSNSGSSSSGSGE